MFDPRSSLDERLRRESDRISALILYSDLPWIDIQIQINRMREACRAQAPERMELFEAIYTARFERLRDQWRQEDSPPHPRFA